MVGSTSRRLTVALAAAMALGALVLPAFGEGLDEVDAPVAAVPATGGVVLPAAPAAAPGKRSPAAPATLDGVRAHLLAGETREARIDAEAFVASHKAGRDRDAAWMLIGLLHLEDGRQNLASEAFTHVRSAGGPLAPYAAWYEAETDLARGRAASAVSECTTYRKTWPAGPHAEECLVLIARGEAHLGHEGAARAAAVAWDAEHDTAPIGEQIELQLALGKVASSPEDAARRLVRLAVEHRAPLTGRVAEQQLAELAARGVAGTALPDDDASLEARAVSLREVGRRDDAWALYTELGKRAQDDPRVAAWVENEASPMAWRTRHFDFLVDRFEARYAATPNAADLWELYKVLGRAGRWPEAADVARKGLKVHAGTREWRGRDEELGHAFLLAGAAGDARASFDAAAARGGWSGRRAEFFAAFSAFEAKDDADAVKRFTAIADRHKDYELESRYWRAQAYDRLGQAGLADADREFVTSTDPTSWYGMLVASREAGETPVRAGRWPGPTLPPLATPVPPLDVSPTRASDARPLAAWAAPRLVRANAGFASLSWAPAAADPLPTALLEPVVDYAHAPWRDLEGPPPSYAPGALFDDDAARKRLAAIGAAHGTAFPELLAVDDLAKVGLYDLAGPMFSRFYEDWSDAVKSARNPRYRDARDLAMPLDQWRSLFLVTRDHHHTARSMYGVERTVPDVETQLAALRLDWPLAHDRYVWKEGRAHDVDPYLVLGLMRQESTYNAIAVSPVGARGAMQIMPRTGHLLADIAHDTEYTAEDLEDPVLAVGYGITYLGLLLDRFGGDFPLAVASYNGGPHNVHSWLQGPGADVPTDAFVEMMPFRETRNYVKNVSANYAVYLALYTDGERVVVPAKVEKDDPGVVDF
jgi:soluble lytic murein transglycosylase-like protein